MHKKGTWLGAVSFFFVPYICFLVFLNKPIKYKLKCKAVVHFPLIEKSLKKPMAVLSFGASR